MSSFFVLDVPENRGVTRVAAQCPGTTIDMVGPYYRICFPASILIDRRATGCRHAVWYSAVAGLQGARITQHDKNALHIEAR
jgi:hypothetical protein